MILSAKSGCIFGIIIGVLLYLTGDFSVGDAILLAFLSYLGGACWGVIIGWIRGK